MSLKSCKTLPDIFHLALKTNPDGDFVRMVKEEEVFRISYRTADMMINTLTRFLISKGLKKGDRIAVLGSNSPEWAISYLSVINFGGVVVPIDKTLPLPEILHILRFSETKCIIAELKYLKDLTDYMEEIPDIELLINFGFEKEDEEIPSLSSIFGMEFPNIPIEHPEESDLASLIFTSGTTGLAKGVQLTHKNFTRDIILVREWIDIGIKDCVYLILPMNHVFAFTCGFLGSVSGATSFSCARSFRPNEILEDIKMTEVTIFLGVPLLFDKILAGIDKKVEEKGVLTRSIVKTSFIASKFLKNVFNSRSG
ncbi:MAG: AMP-binding protein, partial [bacterium]|nr:AMP-binding protein [bacterium]